MLQIGQSSLVQCGREISSEEIDLIRETAQVFWRLSRPELSKTICEHLGWFTASGGYKVDACGKLLEKLEARGVVTLPSKVSRPRRKDGVMPVVRATERTAPQGEIISKLKDIGLVRLEVVTDKDDVKLWNEYVALYHYLGYKRPFGCFLRYFICSQAGILGCMLLSGAAKALRVRDRWIGWSQEQRFENLPWLINNSRFLIFPWVCVSNLSSHVLGQLARRVRGDWLHRWGYSPVLMETFVDPLHFRGVSYKASNWEYLGQTTGKGLVRQGRTYSTTPRMIFVKPLVKDFRRQLVSGALVGRVEQ
jgi:hypothetical protein